MNRSTSRRYLPPLGLFATYSLVSAAMGVLVVLIMGVGRGSQFSLGAFGAGALLGICLNAGATLAEAGFYALLGVNRSWALAARAGLSAVTYFVGGGCGYLVARAISGTLGFSAFDLEGGVVATLPVFGLVTVAVGMAFFVVRVLSGRLAHSVARIKEQEHAEKELLTAGDLQRRLLPPGSVIGAGYRIEARNLPARTVAGDFYDVFRLPGDAIGLVVGDVAGKGLSASLLMASVKAMLPLVAADRSVTETLIELNTRLVRDLGPREFVALAFARYEPRTGRVELGNAGLPDPYRLAGEPESIEAPGARLPLGVRWQVDYGSIEFVLDRGEALLMLSDGIPETLLADGSPLGYETLDSLLGRNGADAGEWLDGLLARVRERGNGVQQDDWTVLLLERER